MPDGSTSGPRTLSSLAIPCFASGRIALFSIFLPRFAQARTSYDISKLLSIGPTAWDASEENGMAICTGDRVVVLLTMITALVSAWPNGLCPLNMKFARPSQKFRWLNTALIVVGVLRGSTRRMLACRPQKQVPFDNQEDTGNSAPTLTRCYIRWLCQCN